MRIYGLILIVAALLLAGCTTHTYSGVTRNDPAPDFTLTDKTGSDFTLSSYTGKWILLAYGYTHCPDVCPMTLSVLHDVKKKSGLSDEQLGVVFVSIDPERDTPDIVGNFVTHFDKSFMGVSGTPEEVAAAAQPYGVKYEKKASTPAVGYVMNHTAFVYLIDPKFQWRVTFPFGVTADEIAGDLKYLISQAKP